MDDLAHLAGQRFDAPGFPAAMVDHRQRVLATGDAAWQLRCIPQRVTAVDARQADEVVRARWQVRRPLQGIGAPGVVRRGQAEAKVQDDIQQHGGDADGHDETANRRQQVRQIPAQFALIGVDAPGHAHQARPVHDQEGQVEAHEHQPEAPAAQSYRGHAPGKVRQPVVHAGQQWEEHAADQHVMHVRHDEMGVVHLPVEGHQGQHHPGQAAADENQQKTHQPQHRHVIHRPPQP